MNKNFTIKNICDFIWQLEEELNLFDQQIENIYFWPLIRFQVYYEIVQKVKVYSTPHPNKVNNLFDVIARLSQVFTAIFIRNPLLNHKTGDFLFLPHHRQFYGNDIYSQSLLSKILDKNKILMYENWRGKHYKNSINVFSILFLIDAIEYLRSCFNCIYPETKSSSIIQIRDRIKLEFAIDIKSLVNIDHKVRVFKKNVSYFTLLFEKLKIKKVFLTISYAHHAAIHAAQEMGIHVTELQHGTFTKFHLGYSFPVSNNNIPYFPNEIACFGRYWFENVSLPVNTKKSIIGAPNILIATVNSNTPRKIENSILFTSQGVISKYLFPFAIECAKLLTIYNITYRLHPSENFELYNQMKKKYCPSPNLHISVDTPDIFQLLKASEIQAGVFSTTLFEGMVLGCKTILLNFPGIEYMETVIARKDAILVNSPQEFVDRLSQAPICNDYNYYYETSSFDLEQFVKLD